MQLGVEFEKIHSIAKLLKQIEGAGLVVAEEIKANAELTAYAVDTRYPGDYDPVTQSEYELVLMMAERAVYWMEERITSMRDAEKHE